MERKVFAGPRLRRVRQRLGLTQSQMAAELGISPAYVNLMERNQRPLSVQVLMKLASRFSIDPAELQGEAEGETLRALKAVFSDPLVAAELPGPEELVELAEAAPNVAQAVVRLHGAYREGAERLSELSGQIGEGGEGGEGALRLPHEQVREALTGPDGWSPAIEAAAASLADGLTPRDDLLAAVKARLREAHGIEVRVLPVAAMPRDRMRFDRHSMRLFLSERLALKERAPFVALQLALIAGNDALDEALAALEPSRPETGRLLRLALARRMADAILMPADRMRELVGELRLDIAAVSRRLALRPSRVMRRLAMLGLLEEGDRQPVFVLADQTGVLLEEIGSGFPLPRFGALCGRLPAFDPLRPGEIAAAFAVTDEKEDWLLVAAVEDGIVPPDDGPAPRHLAMLALRRRDVESTAYAPFLDAPRRPIGSTCRLCEVAGCTHRTAPPATRPVAFLDYAHGQSDHDFA